MLPDIDFVNKENAPRNGLTINVRVKWMHP
jgi:hypothetical protein